MSDGGKGCKPRPFKVDQKTFDNNWDSIFKKVHKTGGDDPIDFPKDGTASGARAISTPGIISKDDK